MKIKNLLISGIIISSLALLACNKVVEENKSTSVMLTFIEYQKDVEPYQTRLIVTDNYMRFDDGEGSRDYILFDRARNTIYSVNDDEGTVMMMTRQDARATPPFELKLEHKIVPDMEEAPQVDGKKPLHYQFFANGELCYDVIAVENMLPGVVSAMQEFNQLLAADSAVTFNSIPADLHNACDMAMSTFAVGRHLEFGFPIQEWSPNEDARSLTDYVENYQAKEDVFVLPKNYQFYNIQDYREGKVKFEG